jgi:hypothetical protein
MVIALALAGCQEAPPPGHVAHAVVAVSDDPAADARAAMARGDWPATGKLLRLALTREPQSLDLHYRLAIAATYLDDHDEAMREFQWVAAHAPEGSEEASVAHVWLASAGRRGERTPPPQALASPSDGLVATGALSGQVVWAEPGGHPRPRNRQLLMLIGLRGTPTKGQRHRVRTDQNGRYTFKDVVAGPYQLTDAIAGEATWRQRVVVEPGRETVLDLSRSNGVANGHDFQPGATPSPPAPPAARAASRPAGEGSR